jgi:hypothetical protein
MWYNNARVQFTNMGEVSMPAFIRILRRVLRFVISMPFVALRWILIVSLVEPARDVGHATLRILRRVAPWATLAGVVYTLNYTGYLRPLVSGTFESIAPLQAPIFTAIILFFGTRFAWRKAFGGGGKKKKKK